MSSKESLIWHPFTPLITEHEPLKIVKGEGVYLHTEDGRKIIDAVSSWWVSIHGHGNKDIAKAIYEQALQLEHVIFAGFTHNPALKLVNNLKQILPEGVSKFFFSDDGSTSIEVALKMAFQYWYNQGVLNKTKVIAIKGAYHGDTFGSMSVGDRSVFTKPFFPFLFDIELLDFPEKDKEQEVIEQFEQLTDQGDIASFIFEPLVQGSGGMRMYSPEVLDRLINIAQSKGIICIADEVMTGFGRTGKLFAMDHLKNDADIMCLSKGLTGGTMAMGLTTCNQKIVDAFESDELSKALLHGHSYTGNPITCAAANASFNILMDKSCEDSRIRINSLHNAFAEKLKEYKVVENVRILGTILAFDIKGHGSTSYDNEIRKKIFPYFIEKGILLRPLGNVIYFMPPYIISNEQLEEVYKAVLEFVNEQTE
ncbi:adenosylmethionine--8-amino-7-oxononanoate transaminase [Reichenbachiella sp. MALMAid0571]|uniref:adenosylmethionine--8-amino-7-oxononanoate transaminase n=1 Tax=Reichenbachiella sp. MALMAid0571 TaxID=3143939 RepID=UPI0032E035EF